MIPRNRNARDNTGRLGIRISNTGVINARIFNTKVTPPFKIHRKWTFGPSTATLCLGRNGMLEIKETLGDDDREISVKVRCSS